MLQRSRGRQPSFGGTDKYTTKGSGGMTLSEHDHGIDPVSAPEPIIVQLMDELEQAPRLRQKILRQIEALLGGRRVVSYYTSMRFPVIINNSDADMLDGILQVMDLSQGLTLILNSPGGDGLAAERIINTCRSYSGDNFEVIVPRMAKSAATMICLGAQRIWMSDTSELGPIDPQVPFFDGDTVEFVPANVVIESYEELLKEAVATTGRIEPYLQQLDRYDARQIRAYKIEQQLGDDVARRALASGMMKDALDRVDDAVKFFSDPTQTMSHGRPIYWKDAQKVGLNIEHVDNRNELWMLVSELHHRSDWVVTSRLGKLMDTCDQEFGTPPPRGV